MNKKIIYVFLVLIMLQTLVIFGNVPKTLADSYRSGKLSLKQELLISLESVPEHISTKFIDDFIVLKDGEIYIIDYNMHQILLFDQKGKFNKVFGRRGSGPGDLLRPGKIAYNGKYIIVSEIGNKRFSLFTTEGNFVKSVKMSSLMSIRSIKALASGDLLIENEIRNYGKNIGQEIQLKLFSEEMSFKKDIYSHYVLTDKYISKPQRINVIQPFQPMVRWTILDKDKLVIGYPDKYEIGIYDISGKKLSSFSHKYQKIPVTRKGMENFFNSITMVMSGGRAKKGAPEWIRKNTIMPKYRPAYAYIMVDYQSNILVFPTRSNIKMFDVFDKTGTFINHVEMEPEDIAAYDLKIFNQHFWAIKEIDEEPVLVKYSVKDFAKENLHDRPKEGNRR